MGSNPCYMYELLTDIFVGKDVMGYIGSGKRMMDRIICMDVGIAG